ncbi:CBS domain-containing protein [Streptomyces sp. ME01-24h]|nr:CBS domain-containing protein [Streptomyces sp. ME19-03-3]MDX3356833.1 CBS domain-containing protein [Streptomyces sp. ME01-24h]
MHGSPHIVADVMTEAVVAVGRDASFKEIVTTMERWKVSALPVLEGEGRVVGVVSEADLLPTQEYRDGGPAHHERTRRLPDPGKAGATTADELMSTPAVCVHADATLAQAARVMAKRRVKRLPVIDGEGMLRGIVSRGDLLKVFLRPDEEIAQEVSREIVAYLFPGEPPPVRARVEEGVVHFSGTPGDPSLAPVAYRFARAVEGVVDAVWD